ncbi:hypothetical protein T492DRAFT_951216 [Pavlovales sp. CCMP2436]|nr:hypothetical protein T492DRAFT_951216 [Pavlovales sp. CCMP2436]
MARSRSAWGVLAAAALAVCASHLIATPEPTGCLRPELVRRDPGSTITCPLVRDYAHSRTLFLAAARRAGAELHVLFPVTEDATLTTDVAILRGGADGGLLLHLSGTHGVEGFVGSAIQRALLDGVGRWRGENGSTSPTVVFVHALNPFGMAHWRRADDDNVDLNRNCLLTSAQWANAKIPDRPSAGLYNALASPVINPAKPPSAGANGFFRLVYRAARSMLAARAGPASLKSALVSGTYLRANGVFYGGVALRPAHAGLHALLRAELGLSGGRVWRRAVIVDVHTGLGVRGADTLMVSHASAMGSVSASEPTVDSAAAAAAAALRDLGDGAFATEFIQATHAHGAAAGYAHLLGGTDTCLAELLRAGDGGCSELCVALAQEFGTVPQLAVLRALADENAAYWYPPGLPSTILSAGQRALSQSRWYFAGAMLDAFAPAGGAYAEEVIARGVGLFERAVLLLARQDVPSPPGAK